MERYLKRSRPTAEASDRGGSQTDAQEVEGRSTPRSLSHPISPPRKKSRQAAAPPVLAEEPAITSSSASLLKSPFQLTRIRDLPPECNVNTVSLKDILGDPLITECWEFNYLHDIGFLMSAFDEDTRGSVRVHVIHGFWKQDDPHRLVLQEEASQYKNVELHAAFMPEMFGTHHSKMMILLRNDDTAQVIIHTANMIQRDWRNMTQGVWRSPSLPLLEDLQDKSGGELPAFGSGEKFKIDLLNYLRAYDTRRVTCESLVERLALFDFSSIKGTLIASVPGRYPLSSAAPTKWGWTALQKALKSVPVQGGKAEIAVQISSIATLGPKDTWLKQTLFKSMSNGKGLSSSSTNPSFKVLFPTADEIRRSLDGYQSGHSIHTKVQSQQQQKQLQYLKPLFCHWGNDTEGGSRLAEGAVVADAGRKRAAPHIKTYVRTGEKGVDWALLTSANLSKQAWGEAENGSGEVRIASWEIGVLVWPELFAEGATMRPCFMSDTPSGGDDGTDGTAVVGLRMPYSLPIQQYGASEVPWVATASYSEPDWKGAVWPSW